MVHLSSQNGCFSDPLLILSILSMKEHLFDMVAIIILRNQDGGAFFFKCDAFQNFFIYKHLLVNEEILKYIAL